jgi:AAHS family 4-hydroxybenzoate transporter-like MFS transporter
LTGRAEARVAELLSRLNARARFATGQRFVVNEPALTGIPVQHLFRDGRTLATLLLWVVFFMSLLEIYFISNWLPTVLNDLGASISTAAVIGAMFQVGGVVGTFVLGRFIDRFSFRALAMVYFIAVFAIGAIGQLGHVAIPVTIAIFVAGFCIVGGQIAANALAAGFYPTSVRATGVGWALGVGRVGSIVGPSVGGILLSLKWSAGELFMTAAAAALCAAMAAFLLGRLAGLRGSGDQTSPLQAATRAGA